MTDNETEARPEMITVDGVPIAVRARQGKAPGVMWLGGYRSDMMGTKALALDEWAQLNGHACVRHDYAGHGESGGDFAQGTISSWLAQSLAVFERHACERQILVGSSMGCWLALRMVQELRKGGDERIKGLLLLAPAPDFTSELVEPNLTDEQRRALAEQGFFEEPSAYSDEPDIYTARLIEDGRGNRVLTGIIDTHCPVHIIQGMADPDVPYAHAMRLVEHLPSDDVTLSLVRDGDHRLSREQDIAMMLRTLGSLADGAR